MLEFLFSHSDNHQLHQDEEFFYPIHLDIQYTHHHLDIIKKKQIHFSFDLTFLLPVQAIIVTGIRSTGFRSCLRTYSNERISR